MSANKSGHLPSSFPLYPEKCAVTHKSNARETGHKNVGSGTTEEGPFQECNLFPSFPLSFSCKNGARSSSSIIEWLLYQRLQIIHASVMAPFFFLSSVDVIINSSRSSFAMMLLLLVKKTI